MACCVFTAYVMNRIIKACELLDLDVIKVQYNAFDDGPVYCDEEKLLSSQLVVSKFSIDGMTCTACVTTIEKSLVALNGVAAATVSLTLGRASVAHRPDVVGSQICKAIEQCGYQARQGTRSAQENLDTFERGLELARQKQAFGNVVTLASLVSSIGWLAANVNVNELEAVLGAIAMIAGLWVQLFEARHIHLRAWQRSTVWAPNMDTLISLSLLIGIALSFCQIWLRDMGSANGYSSSGSLLTAVILGGRYLESLLKKQSNKSLADLYRLQCSASTVYARRSSQRTAQGLFETLPVMVLRPGDEVRVDAGAIVPCDCYITSGISMFDQATLTGESLPVRRVVGDFLMSGTRNLATGVYAVVAKTQDESALEQLVSSISAAVEGPSSSGITDLINAQFVRGIILIAAFCASRSWFASPMDTTAFSRAIYAGERAMAVLASACPCAMGLAIPTAVMSAISVANSRGVQIRGGYEAIRKLASVTHMVMDKTGTLTTGQLSVAEVVGNLDLTACMYICAAERNDALTHPVARAVFQWALRCLDDDSRALQQTIDVVSLRSDLGKGVTCSIREPSGSFVEIHIGSATFLKEHNIAVPESVSNTGNAVEVQVALDRMHVAAIHLTDTPRSTAASAISTLRTSLSLECSLLSGDSVLEASRVATLLGVPLLAGSALPQQKLACIKDLQGSGAVVAMLGDGLNDAPALAAADVGILLSPGLSRATSAQTSVSDVIITSEDLGRVAEAVELARRAIEQVNWNWWWAVVYNVVAVSAAAGLWERVGITLDASKAGMLMSGSSASVVGWSLWFRRSLIKLSQDTPT